MIEDVERMIRIACPGSTIDEIVPRTGGALSDVFEVRPTSGAPVIVKVYAPEWAWKQEKEVHVYGMLTTLGTAVPQVIHAEEAGELPAFTVLTKLDGIPLSELDPPAWRPIYRQLGELLAQIHTNPQPAYGYLTSQILEPEPDNDRYMRRQFAKKLAEFRALGGDPELHQRMVERVETESYLFDANQVPVLCHNDFHEGNVLVDPATWQVNGFIDVENAIAADPLMDLAKTEQYSIGAHPEKRAGLLDGYGELPPDGPERISIYRLYHSLELWDWFKSIGTLEPLDSIAADLKTMVVR